MLATMTPRPTQTLRARLLIIFLAVALVPLVIMGWFSITTTEALISRMVLRQLQNLAQDKAALLEHWLGERKADITVMAGTSIVKSMDPALIGPYLELMREKYGVYRDFTLVSASGETVFAMGPAPASGRYAVRPDLFMSDITLLSGERESTFLIAAPVINDAGQLAGTLYGRVGTARIVFFVLNVSLGKTGECYLVDREGRFLAHKDPARIFAENITQTGSFKNIFEKRDGKKAYLDYRGIEVLGTSLRVGGTDWFVVVEQDKAEAFESAKKLKLIVYMTLFLAIAIAMVLTWIVGHHIVRPIRSLSRAAGFIAESRFDQADLKTTRRDEIGMLYRSVENMLAKLKARQEDLEQEVVSKDARIRETDTMLAETRLIAERSEKFAAMGRMGAAVAHEIRTPLTSLKLFLESVQDLARLSAEDQEDFRIAMEQIQRMEGTINRFLDFARPREPVFSEIDMADLVASVVMMIRPLANRQECALHVHTEENLPPVTGDRPLLSETLINLIVNALEATPDHGTVTVSATTDHFEKEGVRTPCVRIDVKDTGHGIAEDRVNTIFEPFFTTKASGTGLGLPLVLHTVESHGGSLRITSKLKEGTTFSVFLPLNFSEPFA
ncbi:histidine kinase [Desulfosudis oleivorans Hxd3]|uniref:histidine kinase n=2 Tax=Desulfosudis TaxID=2904716 RepID=A9A0F4_DESOH|nr:histidine kinase [Desulfosudis oleivorans Hxd3]